MKRIICLLLCMLALTGCTSEVKDKPKDEVKEQPEQEVVTCRIEDDYMESTIIAQVKGGLVESVQEMGTFESDFALFCAHDYILDKEIVVSGTKYSVSTVNTRKECDSCIEVPQKIEYKFSVDYREVELRDGGSEFAMEHPGCSFIHVDWAPYRDYYDYSKEDWVREQIIPKKEDFIEDILDLKDLEIYNLVECKTDLK